MNWPELIIEILSWACMLAGGASLIIGSIGILRFPDFWARLHAASVTDSAGMILLILGMCLQAGPTLVTVKLVIIGVFLFITGPTATHAVANAAFVSGSRPQGTAAAKSRQTPRKAKKSSSATSASANTGKKSARAKTTLARKTSAVKSAPRKPRAGAKGGKS